jgi:hypothetical protein
MRSNPLCSFHCFFKKSGWISQFKLWNLWQNIWILEIWPLWSSISILIFDFGIDASFWLIIDPFPNKQLVLVAVEVGSLTFSLIINPVSFKMITISLCQYTISVSFTLMPLSFIDVTVLVDHSAFTLWHTIDPVTVISVTVFEEEGTSSVFFIFKPVTSVFSSQLTSIISPVGSLTMLFIHSPHSFILVIILIKLNTKSFLTIVSPVANISA